MAGVDGERCHLLETPCNLPWLQVASCLLLPPLHSVQSRCCHCGWSHRCCRRCCHSLMKLLHAHLDVVFCLLCRQILLRGLVDCRTACHSCRRAMEAASEWWWSSGRSGCELRLCDGSWGPQRWVPALLGARPAQEAALNKSLLSGWRQACPGREETGTESPEVICWRGGNLVFPVVCCRGGWT